MALWFPDAGWWPCDWWWRSGRGQGEWALWHERVIRYHSCQTWVKYTLLLALLQTWEIWLSDQSWGQGLVTGFWISCGSFDVSSDSFGLVYLQCEFATFRMNHFPRFKSFIFTHDMGPGSIDSVGMFSSSCFEVCSNPYGQVALPRLFKKHYIMVPPGVKGRRHLSYWPRCCRHVSQPCQKTALLEKVKGKSMDIWHSDIV